METTAAFTGLRCTDCGADFDAANATHTCPGCDGILDPTYDLDAIGLARADLDSRPFSGIDRYAELLPFPAEALVTMDEGTTPLVSAPALAEQLGVEQVLIKDEGRNPTGSFKDRGAALAITAAVQHGAETVALPSAGNAGQAAAAYAARAGLDSEVFVPSRAAFDNKAMINVHGGEMTVVGGRLGDAAATFEDAIADEGWYSVATFQTPYRHEGKKTMFYELAEQCAWESPDHVVYPTGGGVGLVGMAKAARQLRELDWIDDGPAFHAAQASGCAPIVEAFEAGAAEHDPVEHPDTICGGIEVADPGASRLVLDAVRESGGTAVATPDDEILAAAVEVAQTAGIEMGATCGAAASGAIELADRGVFDSDETVVLVNTAAGNKESDILRSHLMSQGI
ncbi:MAG: threonine synthase [Halapricum sp.]